MTKSLYRRVTKHKQFGNKEQMKTMVSITSCNPAVVNYQVHRKAAEKGKFWQDQAETKDKYFYLRLQKHTLSTCYRLHKRKMFTGKQIKGHII